MNKKIFILNLLMTLILRIAINEASFAEPQASVSLLIGPQTYDAMAAATGVKVTFMGNEAPASSTISTYNSMRFLLSQTGDPTLFTHAQAMAYTKVAYSLCFEALRLERTRMPASDRLFLVMVDGNSLPSAVSVSARTDVIRKMSMRFHGEPLTPAEEFSLLGLIEGTVSYADSISSIEQRLPSLFAGACSVLLGSHVFVAN